MESQNLIETALRLTGVSLVFPTFTIYGIPGEAVLRLENSTYIVEKVEYSFQFSHAGIILNGIVKEDTFTYSSNLGVWTFEVVSLTPDTTGWCKTIVSLLGFENV